MPLDTIDIGPHPHPIKMIHNNFLHVKLPKEKHQKIFIYNQLWLNGALKKSLHFFLKLFQINNTVDEENPAFTSSYGGFSHSLQGSIHPRWEKGFRPSTVSPFCTSNSEVFVNYWIIFWMSLSQRPGFRWVLKTHPHVHHYRCWPKDARTRAEISLKICCNLTWLNATISFQKQSASQMDFVVANLYPGRLTWNIKITQLKRKIILPKPSLWLCSMLMFRGVSRTDGILVGQFGMRRHFQHNHNDQVLHMQRFLNSTF